jgi:hypothetical protein
MTARAESKLFFLLGETTSSIATTNAGNSSVVAHHTAIDDSSTNASSLDREFSFSVTLSLFSFAGRYATV